MKRNVFRFVLVLGVVLLLPSCLLIPRTHKMLIDENNPVDQNATIVFVGRGSSSYFFVLEWNNINIEKDLYGRKGVANNDNTRLAVPAGNNSFVFNVSYKVGNTFYTMKGIELQYLLEAGKSYQIRGRYKSLGFLKGLEFFIGLYDVTGPSELLREWKIGEG